MTNRLACVLCLSLLVTACATQSPSFRAGTPCVAAAFTVTDDFVGARRGRCAILSEDHVRLTIVPEDKGFINDSAWYAFKINPEKVTAAKITLRYHGGHHRYVPKLSTDGVNWTAVDAGQVSHSDDDTMATLSIPSISEPLWVSAQELVTPVDYEIWSQAIANRTAASLDVLGESKAGRPIHVLATQSGAKDVLFLVGRQHPPETTGAFAFFTFYQTLLAETELARRFRERFEIVAVPLMNPDGIVAGHWRHNLGGTDLNRDWGPFKQPETQLVKQLLDELDADDKQIRVFLDFHSTRRNLLYTQDEDNVTNPPGFTNTWLENSEQRIKDYPFTNEEHPTDKEGVSKNYMYHRYGIPASTFEVGDETDRRAIQDAAYIFAEELMLLMLAQSY